MLEPEILPPLRRRRGAQPGNSNRLRHGRYSQAEQRRLDQESWNIRTATEIMTLADEISALVARTYAQGLRPHAMRPYHGRFAATLLRCIMSTLLDRGLIPRDSLVNATAWPAAPLSFETFPDLSDFPEPDPSPA